MPDPVFDHERLDVDRLSIDYVRFAYAIAKKLVGANRHVRDPWLRAAPVAEKANEYEYEYRSAEYE